MKPFKLRAFAIKVAPPGTPAAAPGSQPVDLAYDMDAISTHEHLDDGSFDSRGSR
jgi:hypothetical protein